MIEIRFFYLKSNKRAAEKNSLTLISPVTYQIKKRFSYPFILLIPLIEVFNKIDWYAHDKQHVLMTIIYIMIIIIIGGLSWSPAAARCSRGFISTHISREENFTRKNKFFYLLLTNSLPS